MKKVIVQDTDYDLLETLTVILEDASYLVLPVPHYKDVVSKVDVFKPHVVLLDFKLSGEDSIRVCQQIKVGFPLLPVVALSCNLNIHKEYYGAGFDDYLVKPFDIDHLFIIMQKHLFST